MGASAEEARSQGAPFEYIRGVVHARSRYRRQTLACQFRQFPNRRGAVPVPEFVRQLRPTAVSPGVDGAIGTQTPMEDNHPEATSSPACHGTQRARQARGMNQGRQSQASQAWSVRQRYGDPTDQGKRIA